MNVSQGLVSPWPDPIASHGGIFQKIFPQPVWKAIAQSGMTQPVDIEEKGRRTTMDKQ